MSRVGSLTHRSWTLDRERNGIVIARDHKGLKTFLEGEFVLKKKESAQKSQVKSNKLDENSKVLWILMLRFILLGNN